MEKVLQYFDCNRLKKKSNALYPRPKGRGFTALSDKMLKQAQAIAGKIVQEGRRNNITSFFIDDNPQSISDFANANPILLSKEDTELILSYIETDGFNYTFTSKSQFGDLTSSPHPKGWGFLL